MIIDSMNVSKTIITIGTIIVILGGIFHLQGKSFLGPESSFMYANPEWVDYGMQIIIAGTIILGIGVGLLFLRRN